jgi:tRNA threonylcarbamoyladenosine biosynthesis protein TsaB
MKVLAFDCATIRCSAAVWEDGTVRSHAASDRPHGATQILVPMLDRVLAAAGAGFEAMDRLAVTVGPGHFTGLRAGLAVARGVVLATGLPAVAVTTLEAVAAATDVAARCGRDVIVAIDSKRAEPYLQIFDDALMAVSEAMACPVDRFLSVPRPDRALLIAGDAGSALAEALQREGRDVVLASGPQQPDAAVVAAIGARKAPVDGPLRPFYLHPPAVKLPSRAMAAP